MLILILLLSAALIIPHLLLQQLEYERQIEMQRQVSWSIYGNLIETDALLGAARIENEALRYEISSTHRIAKRIQK